MSFLYQQKILFKYCDPAGIVFYPRYFEMINDSVESWFADELDWPFEELLKDGGVPTVSIQADFKAISRHGDTLDFLLTVQRFGRTSISLQILGYCNDELRLEARSTLVHVNSSGQPTAWPAAITDKISPMIEKHHDT